MTNYNKIFIQNISKDLDRTFVLNRIKNNLYVTNHVLEQLSIRHVNTVVYDSNYNINRFKSTEKIKELIENYETCFISYREDICKPVLILAINEFEHFIVIYDSKKEKFSLVTFCEKSKSNTTVYDKQIYSQKYLNKVLTLVE